MRIYGTMHPCHTCGTPFRLQPSSNRRFCSQRCWYAFKVAEPVEDRFWRLVQKSEGCWIWTGGSSSAGYGRFAIHAHQMVGAHRFSYALVHGPIPDGLFICHTCDNPPCVRPDHLFAGTPQENSTDCVQKQRRPDQRGKGTKLTRERADEIKRRVSEGASQANVAREYGISPSHVSRIMSGHLWA